MCCEFEYALNAPGSLDKQSGLMQQQSLGKAAEIAAAKVIHDAQDYVAAESAAMRNKQAKDESVDQLLAEGELCSSAAIPSAVMSPCQAHGTGGLYLRYSRFTEP